MAAIKSSAGCRPWVRRPCAAWEESDVREDLRRSGRLEEARLRRRRQVPRDVPALDHGPERLLGRAGQAHRLDQAAPPRSRTPPTLRTTSRSNGSRTASLNVAYNCIDRHLAKRGDQVAIIWEGDDPKDDKKITYSELHDEVCRFANVLRKPRRQEGRPRHHLHADDPGGGLRDARLRAHRRDPFGRVRRLLAGLARRPHRGLQVERRHHRRRRPARRPQGSAEGQHRRRARQGRRRRSRHRRAPHRRAGRHGAGPRRLLRRGRQGRDRRLPVRAR